MTNNHATRIFSSAHFLLLTLVLAGCAHARSGLAWDAAVTPTLLCRGDPVTVAWDLGSIDRCVAPGALLPNSAACLEPVRVDIGSSPDLFADQPIGARERRGMRTVFPTETTQFEFHARDWDDELASYAYTVQPVPANRPMAITGRFIGVCASTIPSWTELRFDEGETVSEYVHLAGICNPNGFDIKLRLYRGDQFTETNLAANTCSREFSAGITRVVGIPLNPELTLAANCTRAPAVPPPDVMVEVGLICRSTE